MSNELFKQTPAAQDQTPAEKPLSYIGEGKKYGTVEELDSAYAHANDHIGKIEQENAELRERMEALSNQGDAVEKVLQALKGEPVQEPADDPAPVHQPAKEDDLTDVVRNLLQQERAQTQAESNQASVQKALVDKYGEKAGEVYAAKGEALGISLDDLSAKSPQAVLELFGTAQQAQPAHNPVSNSFNSANLGNTPEQGTHEYWERLHKEGKITRDQKFREQHKALSALGAERYRFNK